MADQAQAPVAPAATPTPAPAAAPAAPAVAKDISVPSEQVIMQQAIAAGDAAVAALPPETPEPAETPAEASPATPEVPKAEATPAAAPVEEAPKGPASKGWAAVLEREKALRKQQNEFDLKVAEMRRAYEQFQAQVQQQQQSQVDIKTKLRQDPFGTLQSLGVPFEAIAQLAIEKKTTFDGQPAAQQQQQPAENAVLQELRALKQEIAASKQQALLDQYQSSIHATVATPEFELLQSYPGAAQEAVNLASKYAARYGKVLHPREALGMIQDAYRERLQTLSSHKAVRGYLGIPDQTQQPAASSRSPTQPQGTPKTITNDLAVSAPSNGSGAKSEREILAELAAAMPDFYAVE